MKPPYNVTSFLVRTRGEFTSRLLQAAASKAGYRWLLTGGTPFKYTDTPALVFCLQDKEILYSRRPEASTKFSNRITLTVGQALAFFKTGGPEAHKGINCTIPEEEQA